MKTVYLILTDTLAQGKVISCFDDGEPTIFETEAEALAECREDEFVQAFTQTENGIKGIENYLP